MDFKFNHNDWVEVTLTKHGAGVLTAVALHHYRELRAAGAPASINPPRVYKEGEVYRAQFWDFCAKLGDKMFLTAPSLFEGGVVTVTSSMTQKVSA